MLETKEILRQVKRIEIVTKHLVDGLIAGNYHSIFKGRGIEFSEIRDYRPGDDIRAIDWKVTARFDHPFIKEFVEERDLNVYFAFDYSASNYFGNLIEKRRKAIELTATLMFSAARNNDNVGLFIFTEDIERFILARKGRRHVLKLISLLVSHKPRSKKTNMERSLFHISNIIKKRSIIFILSDFYNQDFEKPLKTLKRRHDVIAIKINDAREAEIPDVGMIQLEDEETGEQLLVDTSDKSFRDNYAKLVSKEEVRLRSLFNKNKVDVININTDMPHEFPLRKFFEMRRTRGVR
ncbi:MAG: DUF58 domain-containing protein [Candidatus Aenigmarchaeota archaeon]|nr:DUF58 domain-containing protein [Candidatus Aenigmarchaeota archaeon]